MGAIVTRLSMKKRSSLTITGYPYINHLPRENRICIFLYLRRYELFRLCLICKLWLIDIASDTGPFTNLVVDAYESIRMLRSPLFNKNVRYIKTDGPMTNFELKVLEMALEKRKHDVFIKLAMHYKHWQTEHHHRRDETLTTLDRMLSFFGQNVIGIDIDLTNMEFTKEIIEICNARNISDKTKISASMMVGLHDMSMIYQLFDRFPNIQNLRLHVEGDWVDRKAWLALQHINYLKIVSSYGYMTDLSGLPVLKTVNTLFLPVMPGHYQLEMGKHTLLDFLESFETLKRLTINELYVNPRERERFASFVGRLDYLECSFRHAKHGLILDMLSMATKLPGKLVIIAQFPINLYKIVKTRMDYAFDLRDKFPGSCVYFYDDGFILQQANFNEIDHL